MVCELGMSEAVGLLSYADADGAGDGAGAGGPRGHSEEAARTIDADARRLVDEAYGRARTVLSGSADALHRVARALLDRESVTALELEELALGDAQPERGTLAATSVAQGSGSPVPGP